MKIDINWFNLMYGKKFIYKTQIIKYVERMIKFNKFLNLTPIFNTKYTFLKYGTIKFHDDYDVKLQKWYKFHPVFDPNYFALKLIENGVPSKNPYDTWFFTDLKLNINSSQLILLEDLNNNFPNLSIIDSMNILGDIFMEDNNRKINNLFKSGLPYISSIDNNYLYPYLSYAWGD